MKGGPARADLLTGLNELDAKIDEDPHVLLERILLLSRARQARDQ